MSFYSQFLIVLSCLLLNLQQDFVSFKPELSKSEINNEHLIVELVFQVAPGYHIQAEDKVPENIIPTSISFDESTGIKILQHKFQVENYDEVILGDISHKVINGQFSVLVHLKEKPKSKGAILTGEIYYQACDDRKCFYPRKLKFEFSP